MENLKFNFEKDFFLTTDIDWAPDFMTEVMVNEIKKRNLKLTIFATHRTALLKELESDSNFEIGIHPNFTRPTNPLFFEEEVRRMRDLFPNAIGSRSHRNVFGNNVSDVLVKYNFKYDASTVLWNQTNLTPYYDYNNLLRISYNWEDGLHTDMYKNCDIGKIKFEGPGLKVFNVHPLVMFLNSPDESYRRVHSSKFKDLTGATPTDFKNSQFNGRGLFNVWCDCLDQLTSKGGNSGLLKEMLF